MLNDFKTNLKTYGMNAAIFKVESLPSIAEG
jgi:hypothetical protein